MAEGAGGPTFTFSLNAGEDVDVTFIYTPLVNSCEGDTPQGSGVDKRPGSPETPDEPWTYLDNNPFTGAACEWKCKQGYRRIGNENTCRPIPGYQEF